MKPYLSVERHKRRHIGISILVAVVALFTLNGPPTPSNADTAAATSGGSLVRVLTVGAVLTGGMFQRLVNDFEAQSGYEVTVSAAGADIFDRASAGDADLVLVHWGFTPLATFVSDGRGEWPMTVLSNTVAFLVPHKDPASVRDVADPVEAFRRIADKQSPFVVNELGETRYITDTLWNAARRPDKGGWFLELGLSGAQAVREAEERGGYTLWRLHPFLMLKQQQPELDLEAVIFNDSLLQRLIASVVVTHPLGQVNEQGARAFQPSQFGLPPARNPGASIFLPTNDEWHKAAYYDANAGAFFDYPTGTDTVITCLAPTTPPQSNTANCGNAVGNFTEVGSYTDSPSPNGTFDQAGNIAEWTETEVEGLETWFIRGGTYNFAVAFTEASRSDDDYPDTENGVVGFRVATLADDPAGENCGDGTCDEPLENALTCPADCDAVCGDGLCTGDEDVLSCPGECPDVCGDRACTGDENSSNCASDCGSKCGDGVCNGDEGTTNCVADCGQDCGDGVCNGSESSATCFPDCVSCGDKLVEGNEQCEEGVLLADTCQSLGFDGGTLACNTATCSYDTSDCTESSCLPRWAHCSFDTECCSGDCRGRGRCR